LVNEEQRLRIVFLLDGSEIVIVGAEEGFLPVELISGSLKKTNLGIECVWTQMGCENFTSRKHAPDSGAIP